MRAILFGLTVLAGACSSGAAPSAPSANTSPAANRPFRVLMITATAGFRHDSIPVAQQVMAALAARDRGFAVTATEDLSAISPASLASMDVLLFALTSGELPLAPQQKTAILDFVSGGKGFVGVHSATDTLYDWPDYGRLTGAYFKEHPWTQVATVIVEDSSHPATLGLPERFSVMEEFYTFQQNPRSNVHVLLRLDAASVGSTGDYPLAWAHAYGNGRAYYNALGHFPSTWSDPRFQQQILGALRWAARP